MVLDKARAEKLATEVLRIADPSRGKKGAPAEERPDVLVRIESSRSANTRFALNGVTSNGEVEDTEVRIAVAFGRRHAAATTNQTTPAALEGAYQRAARLARVSPEDPEHLPWLGPQRYRTVPASFDDATERFSVDIRAGAVGRMIAPAEPAGVTVAGFFEHGSSSVVMMTSAGLRAQHASTRASATVSARTSDGSGSGWAGGVSHRAGDIDAASLAGRAIDKAVRSRSPARLEPGKYTVVLEPNAAGELVSFLGFALDARAADEGRSFFSRPGGGTRLDENLFGEHTTLTSDAPDPTAPPSPFDGEGLPLEPATWIDKGKLVRLRYTRFWAQKQGKLPTGFPSKLELAGGTAASVEELIKGVKRGLLVTRLWYTRWLDPQSLTITGLTRDGTFLIENGEITRPVNNFRFNESPANMLKNADASTKQTWRVPYGGGRVKAPAIRAAEFNMASISEAV